MVFFVTAVGLLLHVLTWGAGAAILMTPRPWRRMWPVFAAPLGLALQSAVVWAGAYAGFAGTQVYARWAEVLPVALFALAIWRIGRDAVFAPLPRFAGLGALMVAELSLLVVPMSLASRVLTTLSLGSCDAADYAAGARVFQEFARHDRTGFLGLTEVVRVASVDNFYDFWLRLNHFTPSALIAFNDAVVGLRPHETTGILTAILLVATLPVVFWLMRTVFRLPAMASLWVAAIYGLNPVTWYAVAHAAMGQLLAAQAIALLTWAGVALWRGPLTGRRAFGLSGLLAAGYWLIWGSYNFIVVVCLAPVIARVGYDALRSQRGGRFAGWLGLMVAPMAVTGVIFTERMLGLVERFQLFGQFDFGWRIPLLTPEGWLGAVSDTSLDPLALTGRVIAIVAVLALVALGVQRDSVRRREAAMTAACLVAPALVGYAYLEWRGAMFGTNASYDAYKLLSVFFPLVLGAACLWLNLLRSERRLLRRIAWVGVLAVTALQVASASAFVGRMRNPPLIVDPDLVELQSIEKLRQVSSINLKIEEFWSRLWANAFLLRKPQYFPTHTYEGRLNTELKGDWDLTDGLVGISSSTEASSFRIGQGFVLANTRSPSFLRGRLDAGWYAEERIVRARRRWRWSQGDATLVIDNPQSSSRLVNLHLWTRSLVPRDLSVGLGNDRLGTVEVGTDLAEKVVRRIELPTGQSTLTLRSSQPPTPGSVRDGRTLGFAVYGVEIEVLGDPATVRR